MEWVQEAARRRTFAIISHPDAGKTTLTEKFLLYSGAIQQAGAVQSRKVERSTASDWLELEQKRGISVSSAVLRFEHDGYMFSLLDTSGHRAFSEDTYRVLSGVDAAVMVIDAARGVEPQTEKLYAVCRRRGTPIITFANQMDRPVPDALEIVDDIEAALGLDAHPVTWPVMPNGRFAGVVDRRDERFHRFESTAHGSRPPRTRLGPGDLRLNDRHLGRAPAVIGPRSGPMGGCAPAHASTSDLYTRRTCGHDHGRLSC